MDNKKPWYEKISIWITIIAGICAILGISMFGDRPILKSHETDGASVNFENNEIGDQSTVIIGDGNTIEYGSVDSENMDNPQSDDSLTENPDEFSVTASYDSNTPQTSTSGVNILVKANTSLPAERVTISATSDDFEVEKDMHGGRYEWHFTANFYIKGTYTVTVTAYDSEGNEVSDSFEYVY